MHPSSSSEWAVWVPECLQPAIAIATEMPYRQEEEEEEEDDDEDQDQDQEEDDDDQEDPEDHDEQEELQIEHYRHHQIEEHPQFRHHHHHQQQHQHQHQHQHQLQLQQQQQQQQHLGMGLSPSIVCLSCKETYTPRSAGTCRECYEEASETEEELKKEIEELKARIAFLKTWAPEAMGEDCTDLVLESSDGSKIRAHRAVLVSRSSVFKAMLENEMEESRSGTIKITDFSYDVLRLFVHYLYSAEIYPESLDECAFDLLALAEKYNVKHLKSVCERFMTSKVNNDNALFSFEYANQHGAKSLKEAALSIIIENIHELTVKDEYRDLVNRDAKLVVEIFELYLAKQTNSSS